MSAPTADERHLLSSQQWQGEGGSDGLDEFSKKEAAFWLTSRGDSCVDSKERGSAVLECRRTHRHKHTTAITTTNGRSQQLSELSTDASPTHVLVSEPSGIGFSGTNTQSMICASISGSSKPMDPCTTFSSASPIESASALSSDMRTSANIRKVVGSGEASETGRRRQRQQQRAGLGIAEDEHDENYCENEKGVDFVPVSLSSRIRHTTKGIDEQSSDSSVSSSPASMNALPTPHSRVLRKRKEVPQSATSSSSDGSGTEDDVSSSCSVQWRVGSEHHSEADDSVHSDSSTETDMSSSYVPSPEVRRRRRSRSPRKAANTTNGASVKKKKKQEKDVSVEGRGQSGEPPAKRRRGRPPMKATTIMAMQRPPQLRIRIQPPNHFDPMAAPTSNSLLPMRDMSAVTADDCKSTSPQRSSASSGPVPCRRLQPPPHMLRPPMGALPLPPLPPGARRHFVMRPPPPGFPPPPRRCGPMPGAPPPRMPGPMPPMHLTRRLPPGVCSGSQTPQPPMAYQTCTITIDTRRKAPMNTPVFDVANWRFQIVVYPTGTKRITQGSTEVNSDGCIDVGNGSAVKGRVNATSTGGFLLQSEERSGERDGDLAVHLYFFGRSKGQVSETGVKTEFKCTVYKGTASSRRPAEDCSSASVGTPLHSADVCCNFNDKVVAKGFDCFLPRAFMQSQATHRSKPAAADVTDSLVFRTEVWCFHEPHHCDFEAFCAPPPRRSGPPPFAAMRPPPARRCAPPLQSATGGRRSLPAPSGVRVGFGHVVADPRVSGKGNERCSLRPDESRLRAEAPVSGRPIIIRPPFAPSSAARLAPPRALLAANGQSHVRMVGTPPMRAVGHCQAADGRLRIVGFAPQTANATEHTGDELKTTSKSTSPTASSGNGSLKIRAPFQTGVRPPLRGPPPHLLFPGLSGPPPAGFFEGTMQPRPRRHADSGPPPFWALRMAPPPQSDRLSLSPRRSATQLRATVPIGDSVATTIDIMLPVDDAPSVEPMPALETDEDSVAQTDASNLSVSASVCDEL